MKFPQRPLLRPLMPAVLLRNYTTQLLLLILRVFLISMDRRRRPWHPVSSFYCTRRIHTLLIFYGCTPGNYSHIIGSLRRLASLNKANFLQSFLTPERSHTPTLPFSRTQLSSKATHCLCPYWIFSNNPTVRVILRNTLRSRPKWSSSEGASYGISGLTIAPIKAIPAANGATQITYTISGQASKSIDLSLILSNFQNTIAKGSISGVALLPSVFTLNGKVVYDISGSLGPQINTGKK